MAAPPIAILGAGPAGLMLGRLLSNANIDYKIFERDPTPATQSNAGGSLDVHPGSGQLALQEAGLLDRFKSLARYNAYTQIADKSGTVVAKYGAEGEQQTSRPEIDRKDLRALLLESVPEEKIRWASRVKQVERDADGPVSIHFDNGAVESGFRLVIGADGAWSKARSLVTSVRPQYFGMAHLITAIKPTNPFHPQVNALVGGGNYVAIGDEKGIVAQRMADESYFISAGLKLPEHWSSNNTDMLADPAAVRQWLLQDGFADWAQVNTDLIKHSDADFRAWPLYDMPLEALEREAVPGVTLVGDAAHVTKPSGEGVNAAMYDSFQLAKQIVQHGLDNLDTAVAEYEKSMFPRARELIKDAAWMGKVMYAPDAPKGWLEAMGPGNQAEEHLAQ